jgi:hypothetical protein
MLRLASLTRKRFPSGRFRSCDEWMFEVDFRQGCFTEVWFLGGVRRREELYSRSRIYPLPAENPHPLRPCVAEYFRMFLRHIGIDGGLCPWIVKPD